MNGAHNANAAQCAAFTWCGAGMPRLEDVVLIGQKIVVRGVVCRVFRIHPMGTVDVVSLDGLRAWRVSGLTLVTP